MLSGHGAVRDSCVGVPIVVFSIAHLDKVRGHWGLSHYGAGFEKRGPKMLLHYDCQHWPTVGKLLEEYVHLVLLISYALYRLVNVST